MSKYYLIWYCNKNMKNYNVGLLTFDGENYTFSYNKADVIHASDYGFKYYPGFNDLTKTYVSDTLFDNINLRLPDNNNDNYIDILNRLNLDLKSSRIDLLKQTGGKLLTDNFFFVPSFSNAISFYLSNKRHYNEIYICRKEICHGTKLGLCYEDENTICVCYKGTVIGFIPEYYVSNVYKIMNSKKKYSVIIDSIDINTIIDTTDRVSIRLLYDN